MARNFWQTKRPVVKTEKINKKLTISSFTLDSFFPRQSFKTTNTLDGRVVNAGGLPDELKDAFTIEFWAWTYTTSDAVLFVAQNVTDNEQEVVIDISDKQLRARCRVGDVDKNVPGTGYRVPVETWFHVAVTYNGSIMRLYLDGEQVAFDTVGGPIDASPQAYTMLLFADSSDNFIFRGYIDEFRYWSSARDAADVKYFRDKHFHPGTSGLLVYYNFDDAVAVSGTITIPNDITGGGDWTLVTTEVELSTSKAAPIIFGTSYIIAKYEVSLDKSVSLKYPVTHNEGSDLNFGLFVSWTDASGTFQRKRLFAPDGVDIAPAAVDYAGEKLTDPFTLEIWNVDGAEEVSLSSDLVLYISDTSLPTSDTDHDSVAAATLTADTELAANFPLTFPITFDQQQTY